MLFEDNGIESSLRGFNANVNFALVQNSVADRFNERCVSANTKNSLFPLIL